MNTTTTTTPAPLNVEPSREIRDAILAKALAALSERQKREILREYTRRRRGMRNANTPGHVFWYPENLRDEQEAATVLGLPIPDPMKG